MSDNSNNDSNEYKKTSNLPNLPFPMKGNLANRELATLKDWTEADIYSQLRKHVEGRPTNILHDGPPYGDGDLHICSSCVDNVAGDGEARQYA